MNGRFRKDWIRWASRIGRRERVKLADENNASVERGGRPCLEDCQLSVHVEEELIYFTRSARLRACSGWFARLATSSSAIVVELGGCDHL